MKPQRYAARVTWAGNARHLGRRWPAYVTLFLGTGVFAGFFALWPHMPLRQGFIGFCLGAAVAMALLSLMRLDDPRVRGDLAEQWSASALNKVREWKVTNGLTFPDGDLDHVVVTPAGVLAVETKYRFSQSDKSRLSAQRQLDLEAARRAAQRTTSLLRSKEFGYQPPVTPALIVWGPGAPDLPDGYKQVDGTYVLDGDTPGLWSHLFNAPLLRLEPRNGIHEALTRFQGKQTLWAEERNPSLRAVCWGEFRAGIGEASESRRRTRAKRRAMRRRHELRAT